MCLGSFSYFSANFFVFFWGRAKPIFFQFFSYFGPEARKPRSSRRTGSQLKLSDWKTPGICPQYMGRAGWINSGERSVDELCAGAAVAKQGWGPRSCWIRESQGALKGTNLRGQTEPKMQIFADTRRFSPFPRKQSIWETLIFARNRRFSQEPAENHRKPQKNAENRRLAFVPLGLSP